MFSKQNEYITKEFVSALLDKVVKSMVINNNKELYRECPEDKLGILDLEVEVNGEEKVDIEVQLINRDDFMDRLLFYLCKIYSSQTKKGEKYNKAKRV